MTSTSGTSAYITGLVKVSFPLSEVATARGERGMALRVMVRASATPTARFRNVFLMVCPPSRLFLTAYQLSGSAGRCKPLCQENLSMQLHGHQRYGRR